MLDINFIRENQKAVQVNCDRRGAKVSVDEVVSLDDKRKKTITELDGLRGKQNRESKVKPSQEKILELKKLSETIGKLEIDLKSIEESLYERLSWFPNMLDPEVPDGTDDSGNVPIKYWGEVPKFDFEPHDHQMIAVTILFFEKCRCALAPCFGSVCLRLSCPARVYDYDHPACSERKDSFWYRISSVFCR